MITGQQTGKVWRREWPAGTPVILQRRQVHYAHRNDEHYQTQQLTHCEAPFDKVVGPCYWMVIQVLLMGLHVLLTITVRLVQDVAKNTISDEQSIKIHWLLHQHSEQNCIADSLSICMTVAVIFCTIATSIDPPPPPPPPSPSQSLPLVQSLPLAQYLRFPNLPLPACHHHPHYLQCYLHYSPSNLHSVHLSCYLATSVPKCKSSCSTYTTSPHYFLVKHELTLDRQLQSHEAKLITRAPSGGARNNVCSAQRVRDALHRLQK